MKKGDRLPTVHFLVCGNTRPEDSPLGRGCGLVGEHVYVALKQEVTKQRATSEAWVTKTACLGLCPKRGATVAVYPGRVFYTEVEAGDAEELYDTHAKAR